MVLWKKMLAFSDGCPYLIYPRGLPLALSSPKAGNHHDLNEIETALNEMFDTLTKADINLDGLFINADSGFDSKLFRGICQEKSKRFA
ncbi:hypothetical protein EZS27_007957 [termite gut metagenome]|uniref:Transposase DDE domain-containing protein n=1 Tax=termite gut metagenome TaxID=433724 RepID=A0A5J4SE25_9ZZZZ